MEAQVTEKRLNVRVDGDLLRQVKSECALVGINVSDLVRALLMVWLCEHQAEKLPQSEVTLQPVTSLLAKIK
jgi:antitoxin component of RelBE/YafQ-DinJ toxin-antitoxin module